jgi:TRAP transporter 4TM/12TM fusion protein
MTASTPREPTTVVTSPVHEPGDRDPGPDQLAGPDQDHVAELVAEFEAERPARRLSGFFRVLVTTVGVGLSAYALRWVFEPIPAQRYRTSFAAVALALTFLLYRPWRRKGAKAKERDNPGVLDVALALGALAVFLYPLFVFDEFLRRAARPDDLDIWFGVAAVLLVLEATRRTVGWILPVVCGGFLAYAYFGDVIPQGWLLGHRGYDTERLVGHLYMGLEGIFGVPLDVAATYIVLFTIYGAVLDYSGASRFFIDASFAAFGRSRTAAGRTTTAAGFLLGTVSGSGVATTVSLGSFAWPILRRAGYPANSAGGMLAASGIGAILSPPTLGAAAFIIAEFLGVSYLRVLLFATIPTILYYIGVILAIEIDSRRFHIKPAEVETLPLGRLLLRFGYHFSSLGLIVLLMAQGQSAFRAVTIATIVAFALSFLHRPDRMTPRRIRDALAAGATGVLPVAATTAAAGIIVGVVTLTGLGLKASSIIVDIAGGSLALTALFSAVAVLLLGLAVPVTASFIIAAVIVGPALTSLGVSPEATYMFIFYYAVLSEVSPPTALSAVAASAITGGNAFATMMQTWKYTLPAFLVPFAFVLSPHGEHVLAQGAVPGVLLALVVQILAVCALSVLTGGWIRGPVGWPERLLAGMAAVLLLYLEPSSVLVGVALFTLAVVVHLARSRATTVEALPKGDAVPAVVDH